MINNRRAMILIVLIAGPTAWAGRTSAQAQGEQLERGFKEPPDSAKPRAWWHWLNGNITKEGITADLEWMKQAGIGWPQFRSAQEVANLIAYLNSVQ